MRLEKSDKKLLEIWLEIANSEHETIATELTLRQAQRFFRGMLTIRIERDTGVVAVFPGAQKAGSQSRAFAAILRVHNQDSASGFRQRTGVVATSVVNHINCSQAAKPLHGLADHALDGVSRIEGRDDGRRFHTSALPQQC